VALVALENLNVLKDSLLGTAAQTEVAARQFVAMRDLQQQIIGEQPTTVDSQAALSALVTCRDSATRLSLGAANAQASLQSMLDLQNQLAKAAPHAVEAHHAADELLTVAEDLQCRGANTAAARQALEGLVGLRNRLDAESADLPAADERLAGLIALKTQVLSQTDSLADAVETLELLADLQSQTQKVVGSMGQLRPAMIEILAFEPIVERAVASLRPLIELGNLRRLSTAELRQVARTIADQRKSLPGSPSIDSSNTAATLGSASPVKLPAGDTVNGAQY
jgi:hypothetical protein